MQHNRKSIKRHNGKSAEPTKKKKYLIIYLTSLIIAIVILFWGMPDSIMYSKGTFIRWIPFFMIFGIIPILIYLIIDSFNYKNGNFKILAFGSVLILGPIFGIWSSKLSSNDLKENGVIVDGVIIERWHSKNNWMIKAEFSYNGETYQTFSETDTNDKFRIGDNIKIEVSKRNPENNNIIE